MATSFPQKATESETTRSGRISLTFRVVISSSANVEETRSSVAKALSLPTRSAFPLSSISKS